MQDQEPNTQTPEDTVTLSEAEVVQEEASVDAPVQDSVEESVEVVEKALPPQKPDSKAMVRLNHKLLNQYAELRREEHELINSMIDTLARVDDLPGDELEQVRNALFHTDYPFMMVMVGPFSSGKSSVINAILGTNILEVGAIPTTDHIHILRYGEEVGSNRAGEITTVFHPNPLLQNLSFVDTPGLESVFDKHDQITRKFLHRADLVVLVMVATHVISASDLGFLKELKDYGKRTIIVINQMDLLEEADRATVFDFVQEQSKLHLGFEPVIWQISAKQALEAQQESPRDEIVYDQSGMAEMEEYVLESLNDITRVKQKLETPLQIVSNVRKSADSLMEKNQQALDQHRKTLENINAQVSEAEHGQRRTVESALQEIDKHWEQTIERGVEAIRELFQFSRAFRQIFVGIFELVGIAGMVRRFGGRTRAQAAFDKHNVAEPLGKVPARVDKLSAEIEGRDVKDLDDLVNYTRKQVDALPANLKQKVIGTVQAPMGYDRSFLRRAQNEQEDIINEASRFEIKTLDRQLGNMIILIALWELIVLGVGLIGFVTTTQTFEIGSFLAVLGVILLVALFGLLLLPIRGRLLERAYRHRMQELQARYKKTLNDPVEEMMSYGKKLRQDAVSPFTRLIESQLKLTTDIQKNLDETEQTIVRIQRGISALK